MRTAGILPLAAAMLIVTACSPAPGDAPAGGASTAPPAASSVDAEYEQLKAATPVDACVLLAPPQLKAVFPDLEFKVNQALKPQLSGYVWDSRCTYWAGVGTQEFAKDVPTHTVEIFVATSANEEIARRNLASRHETAVSASGYQAQAALGENAYSITSTGLASLFFVKGQSGVQINVSDLTTPNAQKVEQAILLAQSL